MASSLQAGKEGGGMESPAKNYTHYDLNKAKHTLLTFDVMDNVLPPGPSMSNDLRKIIVT